MQFSSLSVLKHQGGWGQMLLWSDQSSSKGIWWQWRNLVWITRPALGKRCEALNSHCFYRAWRRTFFPLIFVFYHLQILRQKLILLFFSVNLNGSTDWKAVPSIFCAIFSLSEEMFWEKCWEVNLMTTSGSVSPVVGWGLASCTSYSNKEKLILWEGGNATS